MGGPIGPELVRSGARTMARGYDIVERSFAAWNARETEAFLACMTDDVVYHVPESIPFGGALHGHAAVAAFAHELWGLLEDLQSHVHRVVGTGHRVIASGVHHGATPDGLRHEVPFRNAITLRDGLICDVRQQMDAGLVMRAFASIVATAAAPEPAR